MLRNESFCMILPLFTVLITANSSAAGLISLAWSSQNVQNSHLSRVESNHRFKAAVTDSSNRIVVMENKNKIKKIKTKLTTTCV